MKEFIKPIRHYIDVDKIMNAIQRLSIEELLTYLGQYGITVWEIVSDLFIAIDFESKNKHFRRVSIVSTPINEDSLLKLALETAYGVKLYSEQDLRNILKGILIHKEYCYTLGFLLPCEFEVRVMDKSKSIVGVADLVCGDYVIELKSGMNFRKSHAYQLLIYMDLLGKQQGFLVYEDKVFEFSPSNTHKLLSEAYERLHKIYNDIHVLAKNLHRYEDRVIRKFNVKVGNIIKRLNDLGFTSQFE